MGSGNKNIDDVNINEQPISMSKHGDKAKISGWQHIYDKSTLTKSPNDKNNKNATKVEIQK